MDPLKPLLNRRETDSLSRKARVQIAAQVINSLVHRLLIEPARAKDANDERRQRNDDSDDERIHTPIIPTRLRKDYAEVSSGWSGGWRRRGALRVRFISCL